MPMITPFDVFKLSEIVEAINVIPNKYGKVERRNYMPERFVPVRTVGIEEVNGILTLLPVNADNVGKRGSRGMRFFNIPRVTYDEYVSPDDVQDYRKAGGNNLEALSDLLNTRLEEARAKHDITLEWHRVGALQGKIRDADGSVIYDLFDEFDVTQKVVGMALGTAATNVKNKCLSVKRHIEENLMGDVMRGVRVFCSPEFFDDLTSHPKVEAAYANWQAAQDRLGGDMREGFSFGGVTFEEYNGSAIAPDGTVQRFIPQGKAIAFPEGTSQTFRTYFGPSDFNEDVNKRGKRYYAKTLEARAGRGYDVHTQSNPLPICMRPRALVLLES